MRKFLILISVCLLSLLCLAFTYEEKADEGTSFNINDFYDYQRKFKSEDIEVCASNATKTYMDYRAVTSRSSKQYWFIKDHLTVDETTGFLYDEDGFVAVALGSYFGVIGDRYYITLDSGVVLPVVKSDEKADIHTDPSGCYHSQDGSIIEFVIHKGYAMDYFGRLSNDYILNGNYNNHELFRGKIVRVEKVLDERRDDYITFEKDKLNKPAVDIFEYASGY
ncbi:MAG: hypothetical protein Q4B60_00720 [Erysipelotrichaceae bacterium]|nr:hypothetical protein [Erysipelotrichaceae bacterium]